MAGLLDQILSGVEKYPGNLAGSPIDLSNTILNLAKAGYGYIGSKTGLLSADQLPDLVDDPIGGSKSINRAFGLGESKGPVDSAIEVMGGFITPGNIGLAAKAVILPAMLLHDASTVSAAGKLINAGREDQVYKATKIFQGTEDYRTVSGENMAPLKAVLPDTGASLKSIGGVLRSTRPNMADPNIQMQTVSVSPLARNLGDVLDHPELFKAFPELADTPIMGVPGGPMGSFNPENKMIKIGEYDTEERFLSTVLHETQHAIQNKFGFTEGSNQRMFLRDPGAMNSAGAAIRATVNNEASLNWVKATADRKTLNSAYEKAYGNYLNTGGELEAQVVQAQRASGNYSQSPAKLAIEQAGGKENIINDISKVPKADDDPAVRAIIDFYNQTP